MLVLLLAAAALIGDAIAFLAIGDRLVGHEDSWLVPLLVAATINGGLVLSASAESSHWPSRSPGSVP